MIWLMAEKAFGEQKFIAKSLLVPLTAQGDVGARDAGVELDGLAELLVETGSSGDVAATNGDPDGC